MTPDYRCNWTDSGVLCTRTPLTRVVFTFKNAPFSFVCDIAWFFGEFGCPSALILTEVNPR